jgi:hypothetical protein
MTDDPLEDIFVKKEEVAGENKVLLGRMIRPFAIVDPENGEVIFSTKGDELIAKHKILVFLLCRLALVTRPDLVFKPTVSPKEIEMGTDIPGGTVRPKLKELTDDRLVMRSGDGYQVVASGLKRAYKELERALPEA